MSKTITVNELESVLKYFFYKLGQHDVINECQGELNINDLIEEAIDIGTHTNGD